MELFKDKQEYVSKVAKAETDACALVEVGSEFSCDFNGPKSSESENIEATKRVDIIGQTPRDFPMNRAGDSTIT